MCLFGTKLACPGQRIFELANALHHKVAEDEQSHHCFFAGKLVILVGEFLQLKPVPNTFDYGILCFPLQFSRRLFHTNSS